MGIEVKNGMKSEQLDYQKKHARIEKRLKWHRKCLRKLQKRYKKIRKKWEKMDKELELKKMLR